MGLRLARLFAALLPVVAAVSTQAHADDGVHLVEQKIKAGLIYNFLKYTQWPEGSARSSGELSVCLFGGDAFDGALQPMSGRTVNERAIAVRSIASEAEFKSCALIVVHSSKQSDWPLIRSSLSNQDVVTVSDFDGFAAAGGMIEFTHVGSHVGVKINEDAIAKNRIVVQDRLLKLADAVRPSSNEPR